MMLLKVDDGKVVFATHLLRCTVNRDDERVREILAPFQVEVDGVVCYSEEETNVVRAILGNLGIPYTVDPQVIDQAVRDRAAGMRYNSRSEAIQHLTFMTVTVVPNPTTVGATVLVTATLFPEPLDTEVTFQLEGGTPVTEPVLGSQATHAYAFMQTGVYRVTASSVHHGATTVEVVVQ